MSKDRYFSKFPIINYSNNNVIDITKRVKFLDKVSRNPYIFYPYDISIGDERAEQFSSRYYLDSYKSWILYLTNEIYDPYYEWHLNDVEFNEFITKKYGSVSDPKQKIYFYRNNWSAQENINKNVYGTLTDNLKKYWEPNYGMNNSIIDYSRKQIDFTTSTNRIMSYSVSNTSFISDEIVEIYLDRISLGTGQFIKSSNTEIYVQHVSGFYDESDTLSISNGYIYGTKSFVNTSVTEVNSITTNIPDDELNYYTAISYYDYEEEKNDYNSSIKVIEKNYTEQIINNFNELMGE